MNASLKELIEQLRQLKDSYYAEYLYWETVGNKYQCGLCFGMSAQAANDLEKLKNILLKHA